MSVQAILEPAPFQTALVEKGGQMSGPWTDWMLLSLILRVQASPPVVASTRLTAQTGAIGTTDLLPSAKAGRYLVTVYARITTPASVNSSLTPTIAFTDGAVACSEAGAALTSNATNAPASWVFMLHTDGGAISFSTAYVSNAAGMKYDIEFVVEQLP